MDNLVVIHTGYDLDLLGLQRDQLLHVLHLVLQVGGRSLTRLHQLISRAAQSRGG
jgi:hypothetical protein